jgi:RHS repeat-associated protein
MLDGVGLVHMNGRVYDPVIGRFLSRDPIVDGRVSQGANGYAYVWNNPLTFTDPSGYVAVNVTNRYLGFTSNLTRSGAPATGRIDPVTGLEIVEVEGSRLPRQIDSQQLDQIRNQIQSPSAAGGERGGDASATNSDGGNHPEANSGETESPLCNSLKDWAKSDAIGVSLLGIETQVFVFAVSALGGLELGLNSHLQVYANGYVAGGPGLGLGFNVLSGGISVGNQGNLEPNVSLSGGVALWGSVTPSALGPSAGASLFIDHVAGGSANYGRARTGAGLWGGIAGGDGAAVTIATPSLPRQLREMLCN